MSHGAPEMGQGERTLSRAAGMVATAKHDFDAMSRALDGQLAGLRGQWAGAGGSAFFALQQAWIERQAVITGALHDFESSLLSTERDNVTTDEAQSASYRHFASRLG